LNKAEVEVSLRLVERKKKKRKKKKEKEKESSRGRGKRPFPFYCFSVGNNLPGFEFSGVRKGRGIGNIANEDTLCVCEGERNRNKETDF
jgi:hypothetical protein